MSGFLRTIAVLQQLKKKVYWIIFYKSHNERINWNKSVFLWNISMWLAPSGKWVAASSEVHIFLDVAIGRKLLTLFSGSVTIKFYTSHGGKASGTISPHLLSELTPPKRASPSHHVVKTTKLFWQTYPKISNSDLSGGSAWPSLLKQNHYFEMFGGCTMVGPLHLLSTLHCNFCR